MQVAAAGRIVFSKTQWQRSLKKKRPPKEADDSLKKDNNLFTDGKRSRLKDLSIAINEGIKISA